MAGSATAKARVIVVDDEPSIIGLVTRALIAEGVVITVCSDGHVALAEIEARPPDLLITDVFMPGGDGLELLGEVCKLHPDMAILVMTGGPMLSGSARERITRDVSDVAKSLGAAHVIQKPFKVEALAAMALELLGIESAAAA